MAYASSPLEFALRKAGYLYGGSGKSSKWTNATNVKIYEYLPTITGGVASGTLALNINGATPTIVNNTKGNAYYNEMPAGHYTLVLNYQGGNNWQYFPGKMSIWHGIPELKVDDFTGDGGATYDLTALAPDGTTDRPPIYSASAGPQLEVWYNHRTLLTYNTHYTLSSMTITLTSLPRDGGGGNLSTEETLGCRYWILPGGGYSGV